MTTISDEPDTMPTLIGEAIVAWSEIEATWAHIFFYLVYDRIGPRLEIDQETLLPEDPDAIEKRRRAEAVFFSVPSSKTQRAMIVALATIALTHKPDILEVLKRLAAKTEKLGSWRNRIVHAHYERPMTFRGTSIEYGAISVSNLVKNQFTAADVARQIAEFKRFNVVMNEMMLSVVDRGDPPDLGEAVQRTHGKKVNLKRVEKEKR